MSKKLTKLAKEYQDSKVYSSSLHSDVLRELKKILEVNRAVKKLIKQCEGYGEHTKDKGYMFEEDGQIATWFKVDLPDADKIADKYGLESSGDVREVIQEIVQDSTCARIDWDNSAVSITDYGAILIQYETRHDNGVWSLDTGKLIISDDLYKNEAGEVDAAARNKLIEEYMEKTGYFPGVYRVDYHGNIFAVNTQENGK